MGPVYLCRAGVWGGSSGEWTASLLFRLNFDGRQYWCAYFTIQINRGIIVLCTGQPPTLKAQQGRSLLSMGPPALTSESIALGGSAASASMYLQSAHVRRPYNPYILYSVQWTLPYNPNVHLLQQVGLFQRGFLLITLPCSTSTYHTLALPQMWTWVAFKRIFDCLRKEGCEAYDIGTGNSCADPFLWRWCKTLSNHT